MTLLQDLIDGASGDAPLATLLRKVKVVAKRADVPELDEWVQSELDGYPSGATLPDYRGPFTAEVHGNFAGLTKELYDAPIPSLPFPKEIRTSDLYRVSFRQPIAAIEPMARGEGDVLGLPWPANVVAATNTMIMIGKLRIYEGMELTSAWRVVPRAMPVMIVDKVRTTARRCTDALRSSRCCAQASA